MKVFFHGRIWCWEALENLGEVYCKALNSGEGWFPFTGLDVVCSSHMQAAVQVVGEAPSSSLLLSLPEQWRLQSLWALQVHRPWHSQLLLLLAQHWRWLHLSWQSASGERRVLHLLCSCSLSCSKPLPPLQRVSRSWCHIDTCVV